MFFIVRKHKDDKQGAFEMSTCYATYKNEIFVEGINKYKHYAQRRFANAEHALYWMNGILSDPMYKDT